MEKTVQQDSLSIMLWFFGSSQVFRRQDQERYRLQVMLVVADIVDISPIGLAKIDRYALGSITRE